MSLEWDNVIIWLKIYILAVGYLNRNGIIPLRSNSRMVPILKQTKCIDHMRYNLSSNFKNIVCNCYHFHYLNIIFFRNLGWIKVICHLKWKYIYFDEKRSYGYNKTSIDIILVMFDRGFIDSNYKLRPSQMFNSNIGFWVVYLVYLCDIISIIFFIRYDYVIRSDPIDFYDFP